MEIDRAINELLAVDREFSKISETKGVPTAFNRFMTDDAIIYRDRQEPVVGRAAIQDLFSDFPDARLTWEPFKAEIGSGGDLGYTLGKWELISTSEDDHKQVGYGFYVTIWKRQSDGNWKYVFDTGINAPPDYKPH